MVRDVVAYATVLRAVPWVIEMEFPETLSEGAGTLNANVFVPELLMFKTPLVVKDVLRTTGTVTVLTAVP